jgi:chemotaxis protein CheZ
MAESSYIKAQYGARIDTLAAALARDDEASFLAALDELLHARRPELLSGLRDLTQTLQFALERFQLDARLADFAEKDIPDARQRLAHVLQMTNEATHRTLDLVEQSGPLAERTARAAAALTPVWQRFRDRKIELREFHELLKRMDGFLPAVRADAESVRRNLGEMLLAQGYQDLTGQIIRGVMQLVQELESALTALSRLSSGGVPPGADSAQPPVEPAASARASHGQGPVIPGVTEGEVASGQQDVDALLSGLGI